MSDLSDIWAGTTFETRDEREARLMSDPTTAETPTMRDRLARAAAFQDPRCKRVNNTPMPGPMHYAQVDAILTELEQPSEGMKQAAMGLDVVKALDGMVQLAFVHGVQLPEGEPPLWQAYRAMIQHIRNEG